MGVERNEQKTLRILDQHKKNKNKLGELGTGKWV
jgi:hypothetical protein